MSRGLDGPDGVVAFVLTRCGRGVDVDQVVDALCDTPKEVEVENLVL